MKVILSRKGTDSAAGGMPALLRRRRSDLDADSRNRAGWTLDDLSKHQLQFWPS
jgi:hypothetical protein